jgi:hypothetical protein
MKLTRFDVRRRGNHVPTIRFEDQRLTSFGGLVVFQKLFQVLALKKKLRKCFRHMNRVQAYLPPEMFLLLVVHVLLGFRGLRESRFYADDPLVLRLLGWSRIPDTSTISRFLRRCDERSVETLRKLQLSLVLTRLAKLSLKRVTLDFDGSVLGTGRAAEGTAMGYNSKKKGQRSYYPLFATVAQTGQVLDFLHRPGNVHDSRGSLDFVKECVSLVRRALPGVIIETRMDGAFFSDKMVTLLTELGVRFTISVPFQRFAALKGIVEDRQQWHRVNDEISCFEKRWKPKKWSRKFRFLFVRTKTHSRSREPIQLDLFEPFKIGYDFTVIVTNQKQQCRRVLDFHHGRGAQEALFAELKSESCLGNIPVRTLIGNQIYLLATLFAHNLNRELQMITRPRCRQTTAKRAPLWFFERIATIRRQVVLRAGRLTNPQGRLVLTMGPNRAVKSKVLHYLENLRAA